MATSRDPEELKGVVGRLACDCAADARALCAHGRVGQQRRAGMGFSGYGRDVALELRYAAGRIRAEVERLWQQVRPLYESLHAYVRSSCTRNTGQASCRRKGQFPRICWAIIGRRSWTQHLSAGRAAARRSGLRPDGDLLKAKNVTRRHGEIRRAIFHFAGIRSAAADLLGAVAVCEAARPRSGLPRQRLGHRFSNDLRMKMCIQIDAEDFVTVHHELGHNFYQRAYNNLPPLFQNGANDGFHEAIGDTIALSITPEYLKKIGLLDKVPPDSGDTRTFDAACAGQSRVFALWTADRSVALESFFRRDSSLPITTRRGGNCAQISGSGPAGRTQRSRFRSRREVSRASNVPYMRYFLAAVLQYQFHRALVQGGWTIRAR